MMRPEGRKSGRPASTKPLAKGAGQAPSSWIALKELLGWYLAEIFQSAHFDAPWPTPRYAQEIARRLKRYSPCFVRRE